MGTFLSPSTNVNSAWFMNAVSRLYDKVDPPSTDADAGEYCWPAGGSLEQKYGGFVTDSGALLASKYAEITSIKLHQRSGRASTPQLDLGTRLAIDGTPTANVGITLTPTWAWHESEWLGSWDPALIDSVEAWLLSPSDNDATLVNVLRLEVDGKLNGGSAVAASALIRQRRGLVG